MKTVFCVLLNVLLVFGYQANHPQEIDFSGLESSENLLKWSLKSTEKQDCTVYYRRIVKYLFDRKKFKEDPNSDEYIASIPLRLNKNQYELLVASEIDGLNMNEVDDLLAEVLKQSNSENWQYPVTQILFEYYKQQVIMSLPGINVPVLLILTAVIVIFLANRARILNFSKLTFSALIITVIFVICGVSFGIAYNDCLNDLEVDQMIQLSKQTSANNPCKDYHGEHANFWTSIYARIAGSSEDKCFEHMRKTFKPTKKYCDPLDVFAKWSGRIQMSYFSSIISSFMEIITKLSASSNFLTKTVIWILASAVFIFLFKEFGIIVIKSLFHGSFDALKSTKVTTDPGPSREFRELSVKMDEILQENQQMKRELTFIRENSVDRVIKSSPPKIEARKRLHDISEESRDENEKESES